MCADSVLRLPFANWAMGMRAEVVDTGYNPRELADVILDQDLLAGY